MTHNAKLFARSRTKVFAEVRLDYYVPERLAKSSVYVTIAAAVRKELVSPLLVRWAPAG